MHFQAIFIHDLGMFVYFRTFGGPFHWRLGPEPCFWPSPVSPWACWPRTRAGARPSKPSLELGLKSPVLPNFLLYFTAFQSYSKLFNTLCCFWPRFIILTRFDCLFNVFFLTFFSNSCPVSRSPEATILWRLPSLGELLLLRRALPLRLAFDAQRLELRGGGPLAAALPSALPWTVE